MRIILVLFLLLAGLSLPACNMRHWDPGIYGTNNGGWNDRAFQESLGGDGR